MQNEIEIGDWVVFAHASQKDQPLLTRRWLMGCVTRIGTDRYRVERITDAAGHPHLQTTIAFHNARGPFLSKGEALIALRKVSEIQEAHRASRPRSEDAIAAILDTANLNGEK